jgi:hypothetical protein
MYNRPLAGVCVATTLFVCAVNGAPIPPPDGPPPSDGQIVLGDVSPGLPLPAGAVIQILGDGFLANANVSIVVYSDAVEVDEVTADADGVVNVNIEIPDVDGEHTLVMLGNGPDNDAWVLSVPIAIVGTTSGLLPATGTGVGLLVAVALALAVAGVAVVRASRPRPRSTSAP